MFGNISQYLEKISKVYNQNISLREAVVGSLKDLVKIELSDKDLILKNGILNIKTNPVIKTEIFIKKKRIIEEINKRLGEKKVFDIR